MKEKNEIALNQRKLFRIASIVNKAQKILTVINFLAFFADIIDDSLYTSEYSEVFSQMKNAKYLQ